MVLRVILGVVVAILCGATASAAPPKPRSLCTAGEQVVYSCQIKQATISVCASSDFSRTRGHVQYRFAKAGRLAMTYPASKPNSAGHFAYSSDRYPAGVDQHLRFQNGGYDYVIYSVAFSEAPDRLGHKAFTEASGLVVRKEGKLVSRLRCRTAGSFIQSPAVDSMPLEPFDQSLVPNL